MKTKIVLPSTSRPRIRWQIRCIQTCTNKSWKPRIQGEIQTEWIRPLAQIRLMFSKQAGIKCKTNMTRATRVGSKLLIQTSTSEWKELKRKMLCRSKNLPWRWKMRSSTKSLQNVHSVHEFRFIKEIIILNKRGREIAHRGSWRTKASTRLEKSKRFKSFRKKKRTTRWV